VAAKLFCKIQDGVPLKLKRMSSAPTLEQYLSIDTNFNPPEFSLDNTFKGQNHSYSQLYFILINNIYLVNTHALVYF
jgi:hypothetical protein